jgi:hypothetical protein
MKLPNVKKPALALKKEKTGKAFLTTTLPKRQGTSENPEVLGLA